MTQLFNLLSLQFNFDALCTQFVSCLGNLLSELLVGLHQVIQFAVAFYQQLLNILDILTVILDLTAHRLEFFTLQVELLSISVLFDQSRDIKLQLVVIERDIVSLQQNLINNVGEHVPKMCTAWRINT